MKLSKLIVIALSLSMFLISCNTSTENNNTDNNSVVTTQEAEPQIDEAAIDSIASKLDDMEAELDDIFEGLE